MAGILTPGAARELVGALVKALPEMPIQVHSHMTSGMAAAMYLAAVEAGAGCVDCAISTMSSFSSQPPCESMVTILESEGYDTGLNQKKLAEINAYFRELKAKRQPASTAKVEPVDAGVLVHAIPGGMISNLRSQLAQQGALDRLPEVLAELPKTRADMGYPPLVTPTSQIVGVQSVLNVLSGKRYSMITDETKHYAAGYYGRTPAPIEKKLAKKLQGGLKPITCRPADLLKPGLAAPTASSPRWRSATSSGVRSPMTRRIRSPPTWRCRRQRRRNPPRAHPCRPTTQSLLQSARPSPRSWRPWEAGRLTSPPSSSGNRRFKREGRNLLRPKLREGRAPVRPRPARPNRPPAHPSWRPSTARSTAAQARASLRWRRTVTPSRPVTPSASSRR